MKTIVNFRDLGGIPTQSGMYVQPHRILRSGELVSLSETAKNTLIDTYNLYNIVDLRSSKEVQRSPDDIFSGVHYHHLDVMSEIQNSVSSKSFIKNRNLDPFESMKKVYRTIISNKNASLEYRKLIDILLNTENGSTLFHCFAGKDRTGIAAAIILTILDVDKSSIFEDYLLTNTLRIEANNKRLSELKAQGLSSIELDTIATFLVVSPEYLTAAYDEATKLYGSFMQYIQESLHVTTDEINQLQQMYLVDAL